MPVKPMFRGIDANGLVQPSMVDEIRLTVSFKIPAVQPDRSGHGALKDTGGPGLLRRIVGIVVVVLLGQSHLNRPYEAGCVLHERIPLELRRRPSDLSEAT